MQNQIERVCPKCGNVLKREWVACPICGWEYTESSKISHKATKISIICSIISFFIFPYYLGIIGIGIGLYAVGENKDEWGYFAITLGIGILLLNFLFLLYD